jgi:hypothetical protein
MKAELDTATSATSQECPFLVQHEGKPVFDWEKSWRSACEEANIAGTLFHDFGPYRLNEHDRSRVQ